MSPKLARSRPRVVLRASIGTCSNKSIAARDSPSAFPSPTRMLHPLNDIDRKKERRKRIYDQLKFFPSSYHDETTCKCNIALCMSNRVCFLSDDKIPLAHDRYRDRSRGSSMNNDVKPASKIV